MTDYSIPREDNKYNRPLLYTPDSVERVAYSRPSTLGKDLDDGKSLAPWEQSMVAIGLAKRPNLFARVQSIIARGGSWGTDRKQLKEIMAQAKEAAGWKDQADRGTAIHDFTDAADQGILDRDFVPEHLKGPVFWYEENIAPKFKVIATECFVAVDNLVELPGRESIVLRAAGSIDRICEYEGKRYVADIKGLALDTKIPTPDGWTTIGDIQVGDKVFGSDGQPCSVVVKSDVKRIGTYIVTFSDGTKVVCDREHLWWTQTQGDRIRGNLRPHLGVRPPKARSVEEVGATLTWGGQKHHWVPVVDPLSLPEAELPIPPYTLGVWLGDGRCARGGITSADTDVFEGIEADGYVLGAEYRKPGAVACERVPRGLQRQLRKAGLLNNKHIPLNYLRASHEQRLALLMGLMDSDGTWNTPRKRALFTNCNKQLAMDVVELLLTLGQIPHIAEVPAYGFGISTTAYHVEFTPRGIIPFRLQRKVSKINNRQTSNSGHRLIVSVDPGPDVPTACIGVDSPNHTYLCSESFIPTHNTGKDDQFRMGVCGQLWLYSQGKMYADDLVDQDQKYPDMNWVASQNNPSKRAEIDVDQDWAIMLKAPKFATSGEWKWKAYWIPLNKGREIIECGQWARKARYVPEFTQFEP